MNPSTASTRLSGAISTPEGRWIAILVAAELLSLLAYFGLTSAAATTPRYVLYPFVWINLGLWAVLKTNPRSVTRRLHWLAAGIAAAYFVALVDVSGLIGIYLDHAHAHAHPVSGFQFAMTSPGWGPRIGYAGEHFHVNFVPYRVIGYLSLAYLAYARILDVTAAALSGLLGLASCVGCSFPIFASVLAGLVGGSSALTTAAWTFSMDISTVAFVLAVALLYRGGVD